VAIDAAIDATIASEIPTAAIAASEIATAATVAS
jgi:hypothetical protein